MLVDKFMKFLKEQDPPFPCGIHKGWFEIDEGIIEVEKLEIFLCGLAKSPKTETPMNKGQNAVD